MGLPGMQQRVRAAQEREAYAGITEVGRRFLSQALVRYVLNSHEYAARREGVPDKHRFSILPGDIADHEEHELARWLAHEAPAALGIYPHIEKEVDTVYRCQIITGKSGTLIEGTEKIPEINAYPTLHPGIVCMSIETPNQNNGRLVVASMLNELIKTGKWKPTRVTQVTDRKTGKSEPVTSYDNVAGYKGKAEEYEAWLKSLKPSVDLLLPAGSKSIIIAGNPINAEEVREHLQRYLSSVDNYTSVWGLR